MRQIIDNYLYNNKNSVLLVADFGKFPLMETTDRYYNVGLSETLLVNVAIGLAITKKHVFIYSAANFVLYRAYEQIKLYLNDQKNNLNITFLNGGSGFCYAECGRGHYLIDDLNLIFSNLQNINILLPYDETTTYKCLKQTNTKISYIRLCPDSSQNYTIRKKYNNIIITFGWLVQYIQYIIDKYDIRYDIYPILRLKDIYNIKYNEFNKVKFIYDNININNINLPQNILIKNFNNIFDKTGFTQKDVLKKYKFDEKSLYNFIKL